MVLRKNQDGSYTSRVKRKTEKIQAHHNDEEYARLVKDMYVLNQPKEGTALKQLAQIGSKLLHGESIGSISVHIANTIIDNKKKNKRTGLDAEYE